MKLAHSLTRLACYVGLFSVLYSAGITFTDWRYWLFLGLLLIVVTSLQFDK